MTSPKISIVIGAYNCGKFIQATMQSVIDQTFKDWELIVVDDGSNDDTFQKISTAPDERIKVIRLKENSGLPAVSRNMGIKVSRGELIAFLDHDDIWFPNKLKAQVDYFVKNPDVGLSACSLRVKSPDKRYNNTIIPVTHRRQLGYIHNQLLNSDFIVSSSVIVKRAILHDIGYFDETPEMASVEDWDLWLRIAYRHKIAFIPQVLGIYMVHNTNFSMSIERLQKAFYVIDKHCREGFVTPLQSSRAKANFYFREGWIFADKNIKISRSLFYKALQMSKANPKIGFVCGIGLFLTAFPFLCNFIKRSSLDKKIGNKIINPHNL